MPPENLPSKAKEIFVAAEAKARTSTCKDRKDKDECASKIAWSAVKRKFKQDADGNWIPKAEVANFSMAITRTSYDKSTDTRRWKAVASDTANDLYEDNMTLELYEDFLQRIESKEMPPESQRSDFWSGGIPYLSISHYPDLDGKGVPGPVDAVFVDGKIGANRGLLKASGRFDNTPIGRESFKAISRDIEDKIPDDQRIRISIAFLDWMHRHKSTGYVFDRSESEDPLCPECLKEFITGKSKGKEFLRGHLVHLALTRVPVNTRTSMEVERSNMATRKDDAESIVGDEIAEELEEEAQVVGKSEALVIKSEEERAEKDKKEDDEEEEDDKKKKGKKKEMKEDKADMTVKVDASDLMRVLEEIKSEVVAEPVPAHPLDVAISELKSVFDDASQMEDTNEALMAVNEPYEALVAVIQNALTKNEADDTVSNEPSNEISELKSYFAEQFGLMQSQISTLKSQPQQVLPDGTPPVVPERRSVSMSPELFAKTEVKESETPKLQAIVRGTVGLE